MASTFYVTTSQSGTAFQVFVHALAGTGIESADLTVSIQGGTGTFISATGPVGWSTISNVPAGTTALIDATFTSPVAASTVDEVLATLNFTLTTAGTVLSGTVAVNDYSDTNGTSYTAGVDYSAAPLSLSAGAPCFAAGTHILTTRGEVLVENLVAGDIAVLRDGNTAPISWIGHRSVNTACHPRPWDVRPVRVRADALGPFLPYRDLVLSPDHALYFDGNLVPVRYLLNGITIVQEETAELTYFHVELPQHSILIAEGAAAESYLDTGNRGAFVNGGASVTLHADFARDVWDQQGCAPLVTSGDVLAGLKTTLQGCAVACGYEITTDADIHLVVDGVAVPARHHDGALCFTLPAFAQRVLLMSRAARPADVFPASDDCRTLGLCIAQIQLDGVALSRDDAALGEGWNTNEVYWRWTDGCAGIAANGARTIRILLGEIAMHYWTMPTESVNSNLRAV